MKELSTLILKYAENSRTDNLLARGKGILNVSIF
jgi:hypothetical protein